MEDISTRLRARGYRVTTPRRAVWEVLRDAGGHLTAEEIAQRVRHRAPGTNLASVYRALAVLAEVELVRVSQVGEGAARWELAHPDDEVHLRCDRCGRIWHHRTAAIEEFRAHLVGDHGFEVAGVEVAVTGRCAECRHQP